MSWHKESYDAGYEAGKEDHSPTCLSREKAGYDRAIREVVAWLRSRALPFSKNAWALASIAQQQSAYSGAYAAALHESADAIEEGQHKPAPADTVDAGQHAGGISDE